jgi:hypothetical protein
MRPTFIITDTFYLLESGQRLLNVAPLYYFLARSSQRLPENLKL